MKIEKIEANKLKITLSISDLIEMNVNTNDLQPESPQLHNFLFRIMHKVREETGFEITSGPLLTKTIPTETGLTLFVSRLMPQMFRIKTKKVTPSKKNIKNVHAKIRKKDEEQIIYRFKSWDDFTSALSCCNDSISAEAVYQMNQSYYLVCNVTEPAPLLREFALSATNDTLLLSILSEHGTLIAQKEQIYALKNL